jgi:hypothetical protein
MRRLKQMRADPRWQQARLIKKAHNQERTVLFSQLRQEYGFEAGAVVWIAWKARVISKVFALCCNQQSKAMQGISSGGKIISRSTLTGVIQWSVMDSSIISNSLVFSDAAPQVSGQKEPIARAIAERNNASPTRSANWPPIARACTGGSCMRLCPVAIG